ncbi:MAG: DUF3817 domain-containing protein [Planctomycetota bacterium]
MFSRAVLRLRVVSLLEGLSYLALVFVAMPLKYAWGEPGAVRVVGMAHGVLFVAFVLALVLATRAARLGLGTQARLFVLSLIPFGFVLIEKQLAGLSDAPTG